MGTKFRPITHIITGKAPVNPWPPTGSYLLCARLYTNTFLDHITMNTVSWNYDGGSSPTYADANCTQQLSDLSSWDDGTYNTVLQTTGQNEYGTYVDIFTDSSKTSESAEDFCVILGNDRRQTITDDSWKITRVEVFKVGMSNGIYKVNNSPSKGLWFRNRNDWTEFPLTPSSSTIFRPISIFENKKDSDTVEIFGKEYRTVTINGVTWLAENFAYDDGESNITTRILSDVNGYDLGTQYYYNLSAARRVANKVNGWHLASMNEWNSLVNYLAQEYSNNNKQALLASTYAWNNNQHGVDLGRMTCLPCGWIRSSPELEGQQARFWVSDTDRDRNFYIYSGQLSSERVELGWETNKSYTIGMSIRLVKD